MNDGKTYYRLVNGELEFINTDNWHELVEEENYFIAYCPGIEKDGTFSRYVFLPEVFNNRKEAIQKKRELQKTLHFVLKNKITIVSRTTTILYIFRNLIEKEYATKEQIANFLGIEKYDLAIPHQWIEYAHALVNWATREMLVTNFVWSYEKEWSGRPLPLTETGRTILETLHELEKQ